MRLQDYRSNILPVALACVLGSFSSSAQQTADSVGVRYLGEVVVEAPRVVHKPDMDVYHPSRSAVEYSKNGVQLLANLMIPSLAVSDALGSVTSAGQPVQVRINGREASVDEVKNLLPATIRRVEWIESPGLRYSGASAVLNFIVVNPTVGGSLMLNAMQAVDMAWGQYNPNVKFNSGRSQLEVGGGYKLTENLKVHREYREMFIRPDGTYLLRDEKSAGGRLDNSIGNVWASYSYVIPDTTVIVVDARGFIKPTNQTVYRGLMSSHTFDYGSIASEHGVEEVLLTDVNGDRGSRPSLSAYWEQHFGAQQILVVDFKSQFYSGRTFSDYSEQLPDSREYITDIHTDIKDRNQLYAVEADYIKHWAMSRLTAGASYIANRNRSVYESLGGRVFHQRQDKAYFFAEYFQRVKAMTFTAGIGAQYTDFLFRETDLGSSSWNLRPQAAITYAFNQRHQLRLNFESWQSTPSLAETNPVPQQIDAFQWRVGNTDITTSNSYMLTLRYNFQLPRVYGQFGVRAFTSPDAITPLLMWEGEKLITTYENSCGLKNVSLFLAPQIEVVPGWLTVSGYVQWRAEKMRGTGYCLTNNAWSGNAMMQLRHWGFTLTGQYFRAQRDLWGEKISWGEDMNIIDLSYNWKQWSFSAGCLMPFGRYDQGSEFLSKLVTNERHLRTDFRVPYIGVNYNLQWGHQKRKAGKRINVGGDTDQSTAGGR